MRKYIYIWCLVALTSLQSCLFNEDDKFSESAAERISGAIEDDKQLLESASNGWTLHYYTGQQYTGGGYTLLLKFNNGKVKVASDYTDVDATASSSYDVIGDEGPVLTFNTYNSILHQLAEVSISDVDGQQGDYEFNIMRISEAKDSIILKGKKWGNYMTLVRNDDKMDWKTYLTQVENMKNEMWYTYNFISGKDTIGSMTLDPDSRRATIINGRNVTYEPYYVTPSGISFPYNADLGNISADQLKFNAKDSTLEASSNNTVVKAFIPAGWHSYDDFMHNWVIYYNNWNGTLHLKCKPKSSTEIYATFTYTDGLDYTFVLKYSKAKGTLSWTVQDIADPSGQYDHLKILAYDSSQGYLTWMPGVGLTTHWNNSSFELTDNAAWVGYSVNGLVFAAYDASGNRLGVYPVQLMGLAGGYMFEDQ